MRDLKIRWSLFALAIGLIPVAYYIYGSLEIQGVVPERYAYAHVSDIETGVFGMILFSPVAFVFAVILFLREKKVRKKGEIS